MRGIFLKATFIDEHFKTFLLDFGRFFHLKNFSIIFVKDFFLEAILLSHSARPTKKKKMVYGVCT